MGGCNAGEIASALAAETIHAHLTDAVRNRDLPLMGPGNAMVSDAANRLASAIHAANYAILDESGRDSNHLGMGTTVVAALLHGNRLAIAHVGDSRLYLVRNGMIHALTMDHSWVAEQVLKGLLTEDEAEQSPRKNIVTRALGIDLDLDVELTEIPVLRGDRLLLCSDGLTHGVRPQEILQALTESDDLPAITEHLITMANNAGGDDNITVLVVSLGRS